jgi:hypothetical protein
MAKQISDHHGIDMRKLGRQSIEDEEFATLASMLLAEPWMKLGTTSAPI